MTIVSAFYHGCIFPWEKQKSRGKMLEIFKIHIITTNRTTFNVKLHVYRSDKVIYWKICIPFATQNEHSQCILPLVYVPMGKAKIPWEKHAFFPWARYF